MKRKVVLVGAGGAGRELAYSLVKNQEWEAIGYVDDTIPAGTMVNGLPVFGGIDWLQNYQGNVVVVGSLDSLFDVDSECCCSRDWSTYSHIPSGHEKDANPGVSLVRGDAGAWVWDEYVKCGKPVWNPQDRSVDHSPCHMAAQGIINDHRGRVDLFSQDVCASYKYTVRKIGLPSGCVTVHFHGQPKPHECGESWVKECWK